MLSLEIPIKNWGAETTTQGILLVSSSVDSSVGEATLELQDRLKGSVMMHTPIIPIITREKRREELSMAQFAINSWPALITAGRSMGGRIQRGPSHYMIMIQERIIDDPTFVAGLIDDHIVYRHLNELDQMHLTLGSISVSSDVITITSDLTKILE